MRGDIVRRGFYAPYPRLPSRSMPERGLKVYQTRVSMGCPYSFDLRKSFVERISHNKNISFFDLNGSQSETGADFIFNHHRPYNWITRNADLEADDNPTMQLKTDPDPKPILGMIRMCFVLEGSTDEVCHMISYILRKAAEGYELILLEPYNTDVFLNPKNDGGGTGLRNDWREKIRSYLETLLQIGSIKLIAPMAGKTGDEYDLSRNDGGAGQCASWAVRMLEQVSTLNVRTATPDEIFASMKRLQAGGRRRKTRRSKRTKRRGTRHARVR